MAGKTPFDLHHNFPKLAEDSGFAFNIHKPRIRVEWNKIRLIDIESLIRERKFVLIEQNLNDILNCVLESEFDVRILDEGVIKMFRLAQLTIEYQQFCRHYLDRSVFVLKEELTAIAQELDYAKKTIREKEDEVRKNKRKVKYNYRNQLPYGNDNIANMILQTLANKSDIFPTVVQNEHGHYNKCSYCDKVFMNHLYLKSHLARRHSDVAEIPQKDSPAVTKESNENRQDDQLKLHNEIAELKTKLNEMEDYLKRANAQNNPELNSKVAELKIPNDRNDVASNNVNGNTNAKTTISVNANRYTNTTTTIPDKLTKDVQVSTNDENYILDKIEEWKREEYEKYNREICLLRTQITSIVESHKDTAPLEPAPSENKMMEQLYDTIKEQSAEISSLKEELKKLRLKSNEETNIKKDVEGQMAFWMERAEIQSKEYNLLLQKLDGVAKEAQESHERAGFEKERAMRLQILLEQKINNGNPDSNHVSPSRSQDLVNKDKSVKALEEKTTKSPKKSNPIPDHKTLEKLQRRAQELLNQSITSSETSSTSDKIDLPVKKKKTENIKINKKMKAKTGAHKVQKNDNSQYVGNGVLQNKTNHLSKVTKNHEPLKNKGTPEKIKDFSLNHGSPSKIVRAKITEEVNQRLVSLGVDPLKKRIPRDAFQKHRVHLQQSNEAKSKKNVEREKVYHSIISYLNNKAIIKKKEIVHEDDYISPSRAAKSFSLTSVISNVKSKALSLVKASDGTKREGKNQNDTVTKKALTLLKTPPESPTISPSKRSSDIKTTPKTKKLSHFENEPKDFNRDKTEKISKTIADSDPDSDTNTNTSESFELSNNKSKVDKYVKNTYRRPSAGSATNEIAIEKKNKLSEAALSQSKNRITAFETPSSSTQQLNHTLEIDDDVASTQEHNIRYAASEENVNSPKQTKGVLKNASSMSSLYKKKVIFDMDAIQMKSVSASPSQSVTDKSDKNEKYELGVINLDTEEWDLSSIENEPIREQKEIKLNTRTGPKIAELKKTIESQLKRRDQTPSTVLVGGVDVLKGPTLTKTASLGGSNTSLGSSILDDSDSALRNNRTAFVRPKNITENDDSEIDISELIVGDKNKS